MTYNYQVRPEVQMVEEMAALNKTLEKLTQEITVIGDQLFDIRFYIEKTLNDMEVTDE